MHSAAKKYEDKLAVLKYDVEGSNNNNLKVEMLLQGVKISGLPALVLYRDGKPVCSHSGVITEDELDSWLDDNLFSKSTDEDAMLESTEDTTKSARKTLDENEKKGFVSFASQFGRDDYAL